MAEHDPRQELMATQQNLPEEYKRELNRDLEENVAILSKLSWWEQVGEWVPHQEIQQTLERERKNASKLVALQELNEELLSVAKEQHRQLDACAQPSSTESDSEAEEQESIRPKTETIFAGVVNICWQCALVREAVFDTVPGTVNVRRGAAAWTPSKTSLEKGEADILEDMVDQLPQVPDTLIAGGQKVQFMEPMQQASTPMVGGDIPPRIGMSYVEPGLVKTVEVPVYHLGLRPIPRPRKSLAAVKHSMTEVAEHSLEVAAQEFKKIREPKMAKLKGGYSANATLIFNSWLHMEVPLSFPLRRYDQLYVDPIRQWSDKFDQLSGGMCYQANV